MGIRAKISHSAFTKKMTVPELFYRTILNSYQMFQKAGIINYDLQKEIKFNRLFEQMKINKLGQMKILMLEKVATEFENADQLTEEVFKDGFKKTVTIDQGKGKNLME